MRLELLKRRLLLHSPVSLGAVLLWRRVHAALLKINSSPKVEIKRLRLISEALGCIKVAFAECLLERSVFSQLAFCGRIFALVFVFRRVKIRSGVEFLRVEVANAVDVAADVCGVLRYPGAPFSAVAPVIGVGHQLVLPQIGLVALYHSGEAVQVPLLGTVV